MGDIAIDRLADAAIRFGCRCSRERMLLGPASLPRDDLRAVVDAGEDLELGCDACGTRYVIPVVELGTRYVIPVVELGTLITSALVASADSADEPGAPPSRGEPN